MRRAAFFCLVCLMLSACTRDLPVVTMNELVAEMSDLNRLASLPEIAYSSIQFSSYDRRSKNPEDSMWFANEDGFGGEPVPGFQAVLRLPDTSGTGEYLMADIKGPGVIQRLWTAAMTGRIRVFFDDMKLPFYEGDANAFFRYPLAKQPGRVDSAEFEKYFRQYDGVYFPLPFSSGCRIEWIGNIREPHFYHIGIRRYKEGTQMEKFNPDVLKDILKDKKQVLKQLTNPELLDPKQNEISRKNNLILNPGKSLDLFDLSGEKAITWFQLRLVSGNTESALRRVLLKIYFDNSSLPQVVSPAGDFFGAAPGINPYISLPFSVRGDSSMICRFVMPFKQQVRIELENHSEEQVTVFAGLFAKPSQWKNGKSMYFHAKWSMEYDLVTGELDSQTKDIAFLRTSGNGRIAGVAAYLYNPSNAVTSWGNWWGEGDEKIIVDKDTFPSYFGTGSEDYFNYSWSARELFSFPYCGQPRNDGPGNRGYVSNYRWHIADDIRFNDTIAFYMELRHHGIVHGFSYGRIVYYYLTPRSADDAGVISIPELRSVGYTTWEPIAFKGSAGWHFIQIEELIKAGNNAETENSTRCSGGKVVRWTPSAENETLKLIFSSEQSISKTRIGLTMEHSPDAGTICFLLNGNPVMFDGKDTLELNIPAGRQLTNHFSEEISLRKGMNELLMKIKNMKGKDVVRADFLWLRN